MKLNSLKKTVLPFQVAMLFVIAFALASVMALTVTSFVAMFTSATFNEMIEAPIMGVANFLLFVISLVCVGNWLWD